MLTVKQIFELAWFGALHKYEKTIQYRNCSLAENALKQLVEIKKICDELDKKENYITSSNPATETAVLFALNLKEGQVQQFKASQLQQAAPSEYMVLIQIVNAPKIGNGITKKYFSTIEEANKEYLNWKTVNENMDCYHVTLCKKTGEGQYKVLARSIPKNMEPAPLYQVRVIHLTGDEQVLQFKIWDAAQATFELLKYELKVGRIRRASIVKVIPEVGLKQELRHIGEDEEGDDF